MKNRRPVLWISLFLVMVSVAAAVYLARLHLRVHTDPTYEAGCDISETFRCSDVALSHYAVVFGVPSAVWSLLAYVAFLYFIIRGLRAGPRDPWPTGLYWLLNLFAFAVTLAFAYIAEMIIGALCIGCMAMYGTHLVLFALACWLLRQDRGALRRDLTGLPHDRGLLVFAVVMLMLAGGLVRAYPHYWREECLAPNGLPAGFDEGNSCWIGAPNAVLSITEFSDYRCPFCRKAHIQLRKLVEEHPNRIRITHKNFPLDTACNPALERQLHPDACLMARMAYCAGRQRQFWAMNDRLFELPESTSINPAPVAADLGLDVAAFTACLSSPAAAAHVRRDIQEGLTLKINATPTFVIDGKLYVGRIPEEILRPVLEPDASSTRSR
jgi:predicted DsbA family dithiol-disulfide isomerase/uncharacterized membrane protein